MNDTNTLSYAINKQSILYESKQPDEGFQAVLNGDISSRWFFNIKELENSSKNNGIYGIFDGPCFLKGCCGIYIEVIHDGDKIIWRRFFEGTDGVRVSEQPILMPDDNDAYEVRDLFFSGSNRYNPPLEFNKGEYIKLVQELKTECGIQ